MTVRILTGDSRELLRAILMELNPEYVAMAEQRIHKDAPLFASVSA